MPIYEPNSFISFCFVTELYCLLSNTDSDALLHQSYTERALPGLKLFRDLSLDQISVASSAGSDELTAISDDENRSITDETFGHIRYLEENGLGEPLFTFLLSYLAYFGSASDKQQELVVDVADTCGFSIENDVRAKLSVLSGLNKMPKGMK